MRAQTTKDFTGLLNQAKTEFLKAEQRARYDGNVTDDGRLTARVIRAQCKEAAEYLIAAHKSRTAE